MRLWHYKLLPVLPRQHLLAQHIECCALRGNGWTKRHSTVQYALDAPYEHLVYYHWQVIDEMVKRRYEVDPLWNNGRYRGQSCESNVFFTGVGNYREFRYPEHDDKYLEECIENLKNKGFIISIT